jgi:hypothetical protein
MSGLIICASAKKGKEINNLFPSSNCRIVMPSEAMSTIWTAQFFTSLGMTTETSSRFFVPYGRSE